MYIIGTSGHIDHGKTLLIKQLSGIDCDRLPEEKARNITIDIGFASIDLPRFGVVSIIDVPGHERFIRNMVAGAWGLDLALLVVAVDDGWMPQTEDHFRVLQLLDVERIIVVLNKIDLADSEMIEFVEEEVNQKLEDTPYHDADLVKVSSKSGEGIDVLKETIAANLRKLPKLANSEKPYLYIDRVFSPRGVGTIVTGTLKNGIFHENETAGILPIKKEVKIRRIESHYSQQHEGNPSQRTALNLAGVSFDELHRGHIVYNKNFFVESGSILVRIQLLKNKIIKNNAEVEILAGTTIVRGKCIFLNQEDNKKSEFLAVIKLKKPWYFFTGGRFIITSPGGYRIIGGGIVVFPGFDNSQKKTVKANTRLLNTYSIDELVSFVISVKNWISPQGIFSMFRENDKTLEKIMLELQESGTIKVYNDYVIDSVYYSSSIKNIIAAIEKHSGININEISDYSGVDIPICKILLPQVVEAEKILEKDGKFFTGESITEEQLDEDMAVVLNEVLQNNKDGLELDKTKDRAKKEIVKKLVKLGFLVSLDGNIVYHNSVYNDLKNKVMALFDQKDTVTVPEAKESTGGLSRKYIIPLLNRIEDEGLIDRLGDVRVKR